MIINLPTKQEILVANIYQFFTRKMAAKASWHRNYVTVALCIPFVDLVDLIVGGQAW